jgi:hypothetical protein
MRKNPELRIDRKKLLTMSIAAIFLTSTMAITSNSRAFADMPTTYSAGSGTGSFFLTLHRIPEPYWPPCFAPTCYIPGPDGKPELVNGTGTWMNFIVYNSAGEIIVGQNGNAFANEDGVTITGLKIGETYRIVPLGFNTTGIPGEMAPHKVIFNNWADCSSPDASVQERAFTITSAATMSGAAYYRYVPEGQPDNVPLACFAGVQAPTTIHHAAAPAHRHRAHVDMDAVYSALNLKQAIVNSVLNGSPGEVTTVSSVDNSNTTTLTAKNIPSVSLSGIPIGPTGAVVNYNSLYDIQNSDPDGIMNAMNTAQLLGIDWNSLSDMQKAYLTLTIQYNTPNSSMIPSTNLSGVPLGTGGQKVTYNSLYDVQNADSDGIIKAMTACDQLGIDWNSLSDMQKAYLALTLDYGLPSVQA